MSLAHESGISFDGTDLSAANINMLVTNPDPVDLPKPRLNRVALGAGDGDAIQGTAYDAHVFDFRCMLAGTDPTTRDAQLALLKTALAVAQEGEKQLILGWEDTKYYNVRLDSGLNAAIAITGAEFPLRFIAGDPWPKDI